MSDFKDVDFIKSVFHPKDLPNPAFPEIAFAGRSNVGKSSLLNKIFNIRGFVKVSSTPGHTQSLNYFLVDKSYYFVDLPGYGYAKVPEELKKKWQFLLENYLTKRDSLRGVVCIFDVRRIPDELDLSLLNFLSQTNRGIIIVLNKIDKLSRTEIQKQRKLTDNFFQTYSNIVFPVSASTAQGIKELKKYIFDNVLKDIINE